MRETVKDMLKEGQKNVLLNIAKGLRPLKSWGDRSRGNNVTSSRKPRKI